MTTYDAPVARLDRQHLAQWLGGCTLVLILLFSTGKPAVAQQARPLQFSYALTDSATTSAGLFDQDSTLLATLWSARQTPPGSFSASIPPTDQTGRALPPGNYHVRVLASRVRYTWQGVLANSSTAARTAPARQHRAFQPIQAMAFAPNGQLAFAALGYAEGNPAQIKLDPRQPQARTELFAKGTTDQASRLVATDGQAVYWGGYEGVSNGGRWFVFATSASTDAEVSFASGRSLSMTHGRTYASCIDVIESADGRQGGLAVQARGRYLFVSHPARHELRVFDKGSGSLVATEFINDGGALAVDGQDRLWVVNGSTVVRYSVSSQGRLSGVEQQLAGLVAPVSVAVSPLDGTVAVLEGGARQQLRGYGGSDGTLGWVRGVAGGYLTDPTVSDDKFYVSDGLGVADGVFVTYGSDGSVWVGDGGNYRVQHYGAGSGSGGPGSLVDRIQYQPHSYSSQVVGGSGGRRVLGEYLEYGVDYSKSAVDGWQLVRNWRGSIPAAYFNERSLNYLFLTDIFKDVTTLKNGRTYGFLKQVSTNRWEVVELPPTGPVRFTGLFFPNTPYHIAPDGSLNQAISFPSGVGGSIRWQKRSLTGFDEQQNPIWDDAVTIARIPTISPLDPVDFTGFGSMHPGLSTSNGTIISFNRNKLSSDGSNGDGFHLGGIRPGTNQWAWRAAYATTKDYTGDYPTDGAYDIGNNVEYGGGDVTVSGRHIFWNYHGEFWKNSQTNKWHHVYEDGLVVGNFGTTGPEALRQAPDRSPVPGMAGNVFYGTATAGPDGAIYIYHAEESGHGGIHRWRIDGLETIREQFIPVTVPVTNQHGLSGTYMTGPGLNNANSYLKRVDPVPALPNASIDGQFRTQRVNVSVRWQGFVVPPGPGLYTFYVTTDQGVRLWVDNKLLIDLPQAKQSTTYQQAIRLETGIKYPIRLESFGANQLTLDWSASAMARQPIDSKYLSPGVDSDISPGLDLLDGLLSGSSLTDGLYGWQRSPAQEDLTDINNQYWSLRTRIKTYDRLQSPDLNIRFRQKKAVYTVTRSLGDSTQVKKTWRLSGILNQEDTFFNTDGGRDRNGGLYVDVLDDAGRLLVRFNNQVTLTSPVTGRLFINGRLIAQGDYNSQLTPVVHRNQPIDISVSNGKVTVRYGPYPPVTALLADAAGNWQKPRQIRLYFWGDGYNVNRVINLQNLRFFADLGTAQINLLADDEQDLLAASLSSGDATILVSTDGGSFVPYTTPIEVGDVERPAGFWRFQLATTPAAAGQIVYSPAFTARSENQHLTLSPNPTSEWLTIGHPSVTGDCTILLYAADGKLVHQWTAATGTTTTTADVRNLPPGVYVVRFEQNEQRLSARLLVNSI